MLADDLPGVGPLDGDGHGGAGEPRLIRAIGHNRLGAAADEVKGVLVVGDALDLVGELAFRWVELPFADEGLIRCPHCV